MRRVVVALLGMAAAFAVLVMWLDLERDASWGGYAAAIVFAGVLGIGFPVLKYFCKRGLWAAWRFMLLGMLCGGVAALPFVGGSFGFGFLLLVFLLAGAVFGLLFWVAAIWRNDNLTCPKSFCLPCGTVYRVARTKLFQSK